MGVAQWSANYSLGAKSSLPPTFVNNISPQRGHMPAAPVVCAVFKHDGGGAVQQRLPMEPKHFLSGPFQTDFANSCCSSWSSLG